jgi:eukaryotic-like serine/threonine-protein kinase
MRTAILVLSLFGAAPSEFELFTDRGDLFIKAGSNNGLQVGSELTILGDKIAGTDERRRVGVATVMEIWPTLARLALDDAAKADKAAKKFASLTAPAPAAKAPPPAQVKAEKKDAAAAPSVPPPPPPAAGGALSGHATFGGAGPWKLLRLWNDGDSSWSNCSLALMPGNRVYKMPKLKAHDVESVALSNFVWKGPEVDVDHTWLDVKCAEGSAKLTFPP